MPRAASKSRCEVPVCVLKMGRRFGACRVPGTKLSESRRHPIHSRRAQSQCAIVPKRPHTMPGSALQTVRVNETIGTQLSRTVEHIGKRSVVQCLIVARLSSKRETLYTRVTLLVRPYAFSPRNRFAHNRRIRDIADEGRRHHRGRSRFERPARHIWKVIRVVRYLYRAG
jgi:hypothetical protein